MKMGRIQVQTAILGAPEFEIKPEANYRPRVSAEHLCLLWLLKRKTGKPITKLVAEAIDLYLEKVDWQRKKGGETE